MKNKIMLLLKSFEKVENSKVKDEGLIQVVKLRLADAQLAQNKYDEALKPCLVMSIRHLKQQ